MNISKAAAIIGAIGGKNGTGKSKRRPLAHYISVAKLRWKKQKIPIAVRFWVKVGKGAEDECWNWNAGLKSKGGYGSFQVKQRAIVAHRIAWLLTNGSIPKDICVLHKCDNKKCCNPKHLFLGTYADNNKDRKNKGREGNRFGEINGRAKLTPDQVREIRKEFDGTFLMLKTIAVKFGVTVTCIRHIISRKNWSHIS